MNTRESPGLLLIELILNILIFAICAAVCTTILVHARRISQEATDLNYGVYLAQTTAEQDAREDFSQSGYDVHIAHNMSTQKIRVQKGGALIFQLETGAGQ